MVLIAIAIVMGVSLSHYRDNAARLKQQQEEARNSALAAQEEAKKSALTAQEDALKQQRLEEENQAQAKKEHAEYVARYIDEGYVRTTNFITIALVAVSEDGKPDSAVSHSLADHFSGGQIKILPSFFRPEFVSQGLFNDSINGMSDLSQKLELGKYIDDVVLAREEVDYTTNSSALDSMITANMRLEVVMLSVSTGAQNQRWVFNATGVGVRQEDASQLAEERILQKIGSDTQISLSKNL